VEYAGAVLERELNSVSDNPVIDHDRIGVFHGGNFHGDYVALEMDKLKIAVTRISMLAERQLNYLLNDSLNEKLRPFINQGRPGLNLGLQGLQFAATSTTAENQTLSFPNYLHSIPSNKDNQDVVSMGANGAWLTRKVIENTFEVLAIECIAMARAVESLEAAGRLAPATGRFYDDLSRQLTPGHEDRPLTPDIRRMTAFLKERALVPETA
jgi:histidine ammonia-lyase